MRWVLVSEAQYFAASRYEAGDGVPRDTERARRYYRLCAAGNNTSCQFKLAQLLIDQPGRKESDHVQAIAWLRLAARQGFEPAGTLLDREQPKLTAEQSARANKLTDQLTKGR